MCRDGTYTEDSIRGVESKCCDKEVNRLYHVSGRKSGRKFARSVRSLLHSAAAATSTSRPHSRGHSRKPRGGVSQRQDGKSGRSDDDEIGDGQGRSSTADPPSIDHRCMRQPSKTSAIGVPTAQAICNEGRRYFGRYSMGSSCKQKPP